VKMYVRYLARCAFVATALSTCFARAEAQSTGTGEPPNPCDQIADPSDRTKCLKSHAKTLEEKEMDNHRHSIANEPDEPSGVI